MEHYDKKKTLQVDAWEVETQRREPDEGAPVALTILYDEVRSPATILSVSSGGIFIKTGLLLELGAEVDLEFSTKGRPVATVRGQVTRIEPKVGTDEEMGLGLRFLDMDAKTWIALEKLLFRSATYPKVPTPHTRPTPSSPSQRVRILYHDQERRMRAILAEIRDLHRELERRYEELQAILEGHSPDS